MTGDFQISAPVLALSANSRPSPSPVPNDGSGAPNTTASLPPISVIAALDAMPWLDGLHTNWLRSGAAGGAGNFHSTAPVAALRAYRRPFPLPMNTRPSSSTGEARNPGSAPATVSAAGTLNVHWTASDGTRAGFDSV